MTTNKMIAFAFVVMAVLATSAFGQDQLFTDPNVQYTFALPNAEWRIVTRPSATTANVECVYGDRSQGYFSVRRLTVAKDAIMADVIQDEKDKLRFLPGYVSEKEENFNGRIRGSVIGYEFVQSGRNMQGRYYFLRANDTTVYLLRFTGPRGKLDLIRNQTDSIARTFTVKQ
jgi:hypothetical protein